MNIKRVFEVMNRMVEDGVIQSYAIAGAVGATFYIEPINTLDVDIVVAFQPGVSRLISLEPLYDYLRRHGAVVEGEHVVIDGWPVQFLPPTGPLMEEALLRARVMNAGGVAVPVLTPEYLAAIALETGRAKDHARMLLFVEHAALDMNVFSDICSRFGLNDRWERFRNRFLDQDDGR